MLNVLAHTTPARSWSAIHRMRLPFSVHTPADRPYGVLFALATASAGVRKVSTETTGPKISSWAMRWVWLTPLNTVGRNQKPLVGSSQPESQRCAPSASPTATISSMRSSCLRLLMAPTSVFLSIGSPTRRVARRRFSRRSRSSAMFSCTRIRLPAQHTWPWLKKMPLTMPSTAWSMGASSKMMLAALPPSSRVARLRVPAMERAIILPTAVEPVKASLSMPGWSTIACPVGPAPVMMLTTPGGRSACWHTSAKSSAVSGVVSAGLSTTVLPHASAGATFQASMSSGKFHGTIWPTTPTGRGFGPSEA